MKDIFSKLEEAEKLLTGEPSEENVQDALILVQDVLKSANQFPLLKLFVWENVLTDYNPGVMFALAENIEQAREKILSKEEDSPDTVKKELMNDPLVINHPEGFILWGGS